MMVDFSRMVVLVVDDVAEVRRALMHGLEMAGFVPVGAGSVAEALAVQAATPLAAAVLDYDLGAGTEWGDVLLVALRERDAALPVVMYSGAVDANPGLAARFMEMGARAVVSKISIWDAVEAVKACIRQQEE